MKITKYNKFKGNLDFQFELNPSDSDGFRTCLINKETPVVFEIPECKLKVSNDTLFIKCDSVLQDLVKNLESSVISSLILNSEQIFGKVFDHDKFKTGLVSCLNFNSSNVLLTLNDSLDKSKLLSSDLQPIDTTQDSIYTGNLIFQLTSLVFYKAKFHLSFDLLYFKELQMESEDEEEIIVDNPEELIEEQEETFF